MESDQPRDIAEFQWRISRPMATILLALIAVPFSRTSPRQGKSERSFYGAAAVFAIYYILSGLAQTWVEQGTISRVPGVWWLYILMACCLRSACYPPGSGRSYFCADDDNQSLSGVPDRHGSGNRYGDTPAAIWFS